VVSADGSRVAIPYFEPKTVVIWDGALTRQISRLPVPLYSMVALSHDGKRLATAVKADSIVRVWDTQTGQLLLNLADVDTHVGGLEFTADGRLIAGRLGGGITIWETRKPPCPACSPAR
jgi:WD40 repeat protein